MQGSGGIAVSDDARGAILTMCQVCAAQNIGQSGKFKEQITKFYQLLSATLSSSKAPDYIREFYIETLRRTADEIESNGRAMTTLKDTLAEIEVGLDEKRAAVDRVLLVEEGKFYQTYGTPMPPEVRNAIRLREWDAREDHDAAQRRPDEVVRRDGDREPVPSGDSVCPG